MFYLVTDPKGDSYLLKISVPKYYYYRLNDDYTHDGYITNYQYGNGTIVEKFIRHLEVREDKFVTPLSITDRKEFNIDSYPEHFI